jgi:ABC-type antimicrobial peptide transport system permease subunit
MTSDIETVKSGYDLVAGRLPEKYNEIILRVEKSGIISDMELYILGLRDHKEMDKLVDDYMAGKDAKLPKDKHGAYYSYDEILKKEFKLVHSYSYYTYNTDTKKYIDKSKNKKQLKKLVKKAETLKIVGIVRDRGNDEDGSNVLKVGFSYLPSLTEHIVNEAKKSGIVKKQLKNKKVDVISGETFKKLEDGEGEDFDFSKIMSVDEKAIQNAFKIDESAFSGTDFSFDKDALTKNMPKSPTPDLSALNNLDPRLFASPAALQAKISEIIQAAMKKTFTAYTKEMTAAISKTVEEQMTKYMSSLPGKIQNAIKFDTAAFQNAFKIDMDDDDIQDMAASMMNSEERSYDNNLKNFGYADFDSPSQIDIFPKDFKAKQAVKDGLNSYNKRKEKAGEDEKVITYTDLIGTLMSSVVKIVDLATYALIAFVSISLVVSSIMIGVITYISVIERRKEIGILRAMGARKRDIKNIFNAETMMIGFVSGLLGILLSIAILIPANIIVKKAANISNIAILPVSGAVALIIISVLLTLVAGLIPASSASKKDAAEALRSE